MHAPFQMFDKIAASYDLVNLFISLGQTTVWRVWALTGPARQLEKRARVLDVGCGTGWVSWFLHRFFPSKQLDVEGLDCSRRMLERARRVDPDTKFVCGDVCDMKAAGMATGSFDMVTTVYTLRNFPDLERSLAEMFRVLRPGGRLLILDAFPPPPRSCMGVLLRFWLNAVLPRVAAMFSDAKAYAYLSTSIQRTVRAEEVARILQQLDGCVDPPTITYYSFGAAARLMATKRSPAASGSHTSARQNDEAGGMP
eukprot:jgi/Mesvir1/29058/Mv18366-RA.1